MRHFIVTLPLIISLTACGAATRSNSPEYQRPVTLPPVDTFDTRDRERQGLLNEFATLTETPSSQLPFAADLEYRGLLNTTLGPRRDVIGNVEIEVDVFRNTVSGSATNFIDESNRNVDGTLEIFGGRFDENPGPQENQAVAGLRGTLTDRFLRDYSVSAQLQGDVLGRNAQAFEATINGAVKVDGGAQEFIKGGIVAERIR